MSTLSGNDSARFQAVVALHPCLKMLGLKLESSAYKAGALQLNYKTTSIFLRQNVIPALLSMGCILGCEAQREEELSLIPLQKSFYPFTNWYPSPKKKKKSLLLHQFLDVLDLKSEIVFVRGNCFSLFLLLMFLL